MTDTERYNFQGYLEANQRFFSLQDQTRYTLTLGVLNTFLAVAEWGANYPGAETIPMDEYSRKLGVPTTTLYGQMKLLGTGDHRNTQPGLGLIEEYENPLMRRQKYVRLTRKGAMLARQMGSLLDRGRKHGNKG